MLVLSASLPCQGRAPAAAAGPRAVILTQRSW